MNTDLNSEDVLRKYKLREPSNGLKERIAAATREEWASKEISVEFTAAAWRMVASLAASLLIIMIGSATNDVILASVNQHGSISSQPNRDVDMAGSLIGMRLVTVSNPVADFAGFARRRTALKMEIEDYSEKDNAALPKWLMRNSRNTEGWNTRV